MPKKKQAKVVPENCVYKPDVSDMEFIKWAHENNVPGASTVAQLEVELILSNRMKEIEGTEFHKELKAKYCGTKKPSK